MVRGLHSARADELAPDSIGAVVLRRRRRAAPARPTTPGPAEGSIGHEILGRQAARPRWAGVAGLSLAAAAHWFGAAAVTSSLETDLLASVAAARREPTIQIDVAPAPSRVPAPPRSVPQAPSPPPAPEAAPEAAPAPSAARRSTPARARRPPARRSRPSPAPSAPVAQAGQAVTARSSGDTLPVFDMASGEAPVYAGEATSVAGKGSSPGGPSSSPASSLTGVGRGSGGEAVDRSRPVRLPADRWRCDWPREAEDLGIDEQVVVLRVVVSKTGEVASVDIIVDPGHGFGTTARQCALSTRFDPARDRQGQAHAATSAPIRVRFTR